MNMFLIAEKRDKNIYKVLRRPCDLVAKSQFQLNFEQISVF